MFNKISYPAEISISDILEEEGDWRDDAPYQRDYAWDETRDSKLIISIFNKIPIGSFHIVKDVSQKFHWILDGKQRRHAIMMFENNVIKVPVSITDSDVIIPVIEDKESKKNKYYLTLSEMKNHKDDRVRLLAKSFKKFKIPYTQWEPMEILAQRDVFSQVNYSSSLNKNERIYCPNFMAKKLLQTIFDTYFMCYLKDYFGYKPVPNNKRFSGIRYLHNLCYICFGEDMKSGFDESRHIDMKQITSSARYIHDYFLKNNINEQQELNESILKELDLWESINLISKCAKMFQLVVCHKNKFPKPFDAILILDVLLFWIKNIRAKTLTIAQIEKDIDKFHLFISEYAQWRDKHSDIKNHSTTVYKMQERLSQMESVLIKIGIDMGKKNKSIPNIEKAIAIMNNNGHCESCNEKLTDDDLNCDHVNSKSTSSKTKVGILCQKCNKIKSNLTYSDIANKKNTYQELEKYHKKHYESS